MYRAICNVRLSENDVGRLLAVVAKQLFTKDDVMRIT
jgi:hypothetical protein